MQLSIRGEREYMVSVAKIQYHNTLLHFHNTQYAMLGKMCNIKNTVRNVHNRDAEFFKVLAISVLRNSHGSIMNPNNKNHRTVLP